MIIKLAQLAREKGSKAFFYTQLESGSEVFSYRQTHLAAAALAQELEKKGLGKDTRYIACNLFNGTRIRVPLLCCRLSGGNACRAESALIR